MTPKAKPNKAQYVAIYARTSKDDRFDKKVSTDQQIYDATEDAIKAGYSKDQIRVYIDLDMSGKLPPKQMLEEGKGKKYRPDFTRLLADIEAGEICYLVARDISRLSRNLLLTLKFYDALLKYQVRINFTHEHLPQATDASGRFVLTVLIAAAQMQLEQTQTNILASKKYSKEHGLKICMACYGYTDNDRKNDIDPVASQFVKRIYKDYLAGKSATQIAMDINDEGARGKRGQKFGSLTIHKILRSKNYIGKGANPYPPIVDDETWLAVQSLLRANRGNTFGIKREFNMFGGMVKCGWTGESMFYQKRKTNLNDTYRCNHPRRDKALRDKCKGTYNVSFEQIEALITKHIAVSKRSKQQSKTDVDLHLRKAKIEKNLQDLVNANKKGDLTVSEYLEMSKGSKVELAKIEKEILLSTKHVSSVKKFADMTQSEKRDHITNIITTIQVYDDGLFINIKDGVQLTGDGEATKDMLLIQGSRIWFPLVRIKTFKGARKGFKDWGNEFYGWETVKVHGLEARTISAIGEDKD